MLAPGVVAGLLPWWLTGWHAHDLWLPGPCGRRPADRRRGGRLIHAFARFVVEGVGTPAPPCPTERLVVGGLYRYVRNPMYLAVGATILGQALLLGQPVLVAYAGAFAVAVAAFVHGYEHPRSRTGSAASMRPIDPPSRPGYRAGMRGPANAPATDHPPDDPPRCVDPRRCGNDPARGQAQRGDRRLRREAPTQTRRDSGPAPADHDECSLRLSPGCEHLAGYVMDARTTRFAPVFRIATPISVGRAGSGVV